MTDRLTDICDSRVFFCTNTITSPSTYIQCSAVKCTVIKQGKFVFLSLIFVGKREAYKYLLNQI